MATAEPAKDIKDGYVGALKSINVIDKTGATTETVFF